MPKALITGASSGIGFALAEQLNQEGWEVLGWSRRGSGPANINCRKVDLSDRISYQEAIYELYCNDFTPDLLIHAAGSTRLNHLALNTDDSINQSWALNLRPAIWLTRDISRLMRRSAEGGLMLFFSSVAVPLQIEGESLYAVMKAGIEQLVKQSAKELAPWRIRVNALGPGPVNTPLWRSLPETSQQRVLTQLEPPTLTEMSEIFAWVKSHWLAKTTGEVHYSRKNKPSGEPGVLDGLEQKGAAHVA